MKMPAERWMHLGGILTGLGSAVAVAYGAVLLEAGELSEFWSPIGIAACATTALGLIAFFVGFFGEVGEPSESAADVRQIQRGGSDSTNYQAGGDITISRVEKDDRNG